MCVSVRVHGAVGIPINEKVSVDVEGKRSDRVITHRPHPVVVHRIIRAREAGSGNVQ